jgi:hypothetical protein
MRILLSSLALFGLSCTPTGDLGPTDDSTPDDSAPDDSAPDDTGMGPCESGLCDLTVTGADYGCHQPENPQAGLEVANAGPGALDVAHWMAQPGCCPTLTVTAVQDLRHSRIDVTYDISSDDCECHCQLDFTYGISGAQPGAFTLYAGEDSAAVTVE